MNPPQHPDAIERAYAQAVREADARRLRAECAEELLCLIQEYEGQSWPMAPEFAAEVQLILDKLKEKTE